MRCGLSNTILIITKGNTSWTISDYRAPVTTGRGVTPSFFPFLFAHIFLDAFAKLRKATIGFVTPVRLFFRQSAWNNSAPTGRIFMKFDIGVYFFFENLSRKFTFVIASRWILLRMKNFWDKSCRENQNTRFVFNKFSPKNRSLYEIMCKKYCTAGQATDGNMAHAHFMAGYLRLQTHTHNM